MSIEIRSASTAEDCRIIEQLQRQVWGEGSGEVPFHLLLTVAKEGGVVLLALDQNRPVGFAFGFPALTKDGRLKIASHQAGVLPELHDQGLGYQIKLAQREATLALGIKLMTWTFDPLQGRNARFNFRKLGAVSNRYTPNLYGEMTDEINQGLPSDRFTAAWWLDSPHVLRRLSGEDVEPNGVALGWPVLNPAVPQPDGLFIPPDDVNLPHGPRCLVEIPADLAALKAKNAEAALTWRLQTRHIFQTAFEHGYTATDLLRHKGRNYYLLQKDWKKIV
ncbi:MAG: hypothetical protein KDJ65_05510 [Anaerolineae bacterium]|nr:hypothetical protein [Anaerolineae bacterium]